MQRIISALNARSFAGWHIMIIAISVEIGQAVSLGILGLIVACTIALISTSILEAFLESHQ